VQFQGLPSRVCWLGYQSGDDVDGLTERARFALHINDLVAEGEIAAPVVVTRDHLDAGSVASPNRETEAMKDGSDAIADWPILNALLNCAAGADIVSVHDGGGVGIGNSSTRTITSSSTAPTSRRRRPNAYSRRTRNGRDSPRRRRLRGGHR